MDYNFEEGVEKLLLRQRKTKKSLCDAMGLTRQGFNTKLKNKTVFVVELAKMAAFFEMDEADLIAEMANKPAKRPQSVTGGDDYLRNHITELEAKFAKLVNQLEVKDNQIVDLQGTVAGLLDTVNVLAGKFEGVTDDQLSIVMSMFNMDYNRYLMEAFFQTVSMLKPTRALQIHDGKVGGTPLSYADNMVNINHL